METETLDKLYLEISQITKAKTNKEINLEKTNSDLLEACKVVIELLENRGLWPTTQDVIRQAIAKAEEVK